MAFDIVLDDHELEEILKPCFIHEAIEAQEKYKALPLKETNKRAKKTIVTPEARERWQAMREKGVFVERIAIMEGVAESTIKRYTNPPQRLIRKISPLVRAEIRRLRKTMTLQQIADITGVAITTVRLHCEGLPSNGRRISSDESLRMQKMRWEERATIAMIAAEFECSQSTVQYHTRRR